MKEYATFDPPLSRDITLRHLPKGLREADAIRIIIFVEGAAHKIEELVVIHGVDHFIDYFNKSREDWNSLPWPSSCHLEALRDD